MRLKEKTETFREGGTHKPEVVLRSRQTCFLGKLKKSIFHKGEELDPARGSIPQPAAAHPGLGGSQQPPGPSSASLTTDPHPFRPAAEAADLHPSHASQAPSQPATHTHFSVWSGSPMFTFPPERRKNKLMKQCSMQDTLPLATWLLL